MSAVNMNTQGTVRLTDNGARIYNAHYDDMPASCRPRRHVKGDVVTTELWQLFRIFGPDIYMGMPGVPFEGNVLDLALT